MLLPLDMHIEFVARYRICPHQDLKFLRKSPLAVSVNDAWYVLRGSVSS